MILKGEENCYLKQDSINDMDYYFICLYGLCLYKQCCAFFFAFIRTLHSMNGCPHI